MFKKYLASLVDAEFIPTGLRTALVVGTLLFVINHGLALSRGEMTAERWISVSMSYLMPYLVNVYGQYSYRCKLDTIEILSSDRVDLNQSSTFEIDYDPNLGNTSDI
jgi:hypothetical protein